MHAPQKHFEAKVYSLEIYLLLWYTLSVVQVEAASGPRVWAYVRIPSMTVQILVCGNWPSLHSKLLMSAVRVAERCKAPDSKVHLACSLG